MIHTSVHMVSLVGILGEPPVSFGNYCTVKEGYFINLWAENLIDLVDKKIIDETMEAIEFGESMYFVIDSRIPKEYLHNEKPCFTGSSGLKSGEYKELYRYLHPDIPKDKCPCEVGVGIHFYTFNRGEGYKEGKCSICGKDYRVEIPKSDPPKRWNISWTNESSLNKIDNELRK
jgi:hypothetical protein